ncbi:MAG: SCO family protein [Pseudomonadota bacterium]
MKRLLLLFSLLLLCLPLQARELLHNATGIVADEIGGDFTLSGPGGKPVALSDYRGELVLLYFGYTSCPDICPSSLSIMQRTMRSLGEQAAEVQGIFVTVDPERDGGERLQDYASYFHPDFIGLEGSAEATRRAAKLWNVSYMREESDSAAGYLISHSDYIYLLDREGELAALFNSESRPSELVAAIEQLLSEKPKGFFEKLFQ